MLSAYMVYLFLQERRQSLALAGAEGVEAVSMEPPAAPATASETAPAKRKAKLLWRTAWLWLPFVAGFAGQAWFDIVKPLLDRAANL